MGINVGGIYVKSEKKEITQKSVADFIRTYWLALGAKESKKDPLAFEPLELQKTGLLGFAIGPKLKDKKGTLWIGVYDSERYNADRALAKALSKRLGVDVWFYEVSETVDAAYAKKIGTTVTTLKNFGKVVERAESFPYAFLYYNKLKEEARGHTNEYIFLSFENIPYRPTSRYSGPSPERLVVNELSIKAHRAVKARDAQTLLSLAHNETVYREVISDAIEYADPAQKRDLAFIYALAPLALTHKDVHCSVIETALRRKDEKLFKKALAAMTTYRLYTLEDRAQQVGARGEAHLAFRLIEGQLFRTKYEDPRALNRAVYFLINTVDNPGVSKERLEKLFTACRNVGKVNPMILHNLACVYVHLKRYDDAIASVVDAVKYGYTSTKKMQHDTDLAPIHDDPRFKAAFNQKQGLGSLDYLHMTHGTGKKEKAWIVPTIGLHLYFANTKSRKAVAHLIEELSKEFPQLFAYRAGRDDITVSKTKQGALELDLKTVRAGEPDDSYRLYYNGENTGAASSERFFLDLDPEWDGEMTLHLPLDLANDPQALFDRFVRYAGKLSFEWGNAGYSLCAYYENNGCPAIQDLGRMLESNWGLTTSQSMQHEAAHSDVVIPNWLTFLGPKALKKADLKKIPTRCITKLPNKGIVIRAAVAPFVGLATNPTDLGLLPDVAHALNALLPKADPHEFYLDIEAKRFEKIMKVKSKKQ